MINRQWTYVVVLLLAGMSANVQADIYKWRDAQGQIHYGNTLPIQAAGLAVTTLNSSGVAIKQTDAALTEKQRADLVVKQQQQAQQQQTLLVQQRADSALLNTYASTQEIDAARDRDISPIKEDMAVLKTKMQPLLTIRANFIRQAHGAIPSSPAYRANEEKIEPLQSLLDQDQQNFNTTSQQYAQKKARFIDLNQVKTKTTSNTP